MEEQSLFVLSENYRNLPDTMCEERTEAEKIYSETKDWKKADEFCKKILLKIKADKLLNSCNIGERFKQRTFETFKTYDKKTEIAKNNALAYVAEIDEKLKNCVNLFIIGNGRVGTGKTHLACAIAQSLMKDKGIPCKFINSANLIIELKDSFDIKPFVDVEVLIIDDLGKEKGTEWVCEQFYAILNNRYENMRPTIITFEKGLNSLETNYGDKSKAIISRLTENFNLIVLDGEDFRMRRD